MTTANSPRRYECGSVVGDACLGEKIGKNIYAPNHAFMFDVVVLDDFEIGLRNWGNVALMLEK
jgi:hypothetical protein